jgi:uncharacterized damage-inducible protein DinB
MDITKGTSLTTDRSELQAIRDWYEYNSFVRKEYLTAIFQRIPEEERYKDRGASFSSITDIFVHIIDAYRFWFQHVYGRESGPFRRLSGTKKFAYEEVLVENDKMDKQVLGIVRNLNSEDLDTPIIAEDRKYGRVKRLNLQQMLNHMVEEQLQHIGELNALFWQMNIVPPVTEYMDWINTNTP